MGCLEKPSRKLRVAVILVTRSFDAIKIDAGDLAGAVGCRIIRYYSPGIGPADQHRPCQTGGIDHGLNFVTPSPLNPDIARPPEVCRNCHAPADRKSRSGT